MNITLYKHKTYTSQVTEGCGSFVVAKLSNLAMASVLHVLATSTTNIITMCMKVCIKDFRYGCSMLFCHHGEPSYHVTMSFIFHCFTIIKTWDYLYRDHVSCNIGACNFPVLFNMSGIFLKFYTWMCSWVPGGCESSIILLTNCNINR